MAEAQLLEIRDNQRVAELEYARAREELRRRTALLAPIDGVVVERNMQPGELADNRDIAPADPQGSPT
jgi:multidrug resistance efflux pump